MSTTDIYSVNLVKLIFVDGGGNNNKYYEMKRGSVSDATFSVEYGRVGCEKPQSEIYPMEKWLKIYQAKTKKGYTDVTGISTVSKAAVDVKISNEKDVEELILELQKFANVSVANIYLSAASVTKAQLEEAQKSINNLANAFKKYYGRKDWDYLSFNTELVKLFKIIPRKMKKVEYHLIKSDSSKLDIEQIITQEQDNLDQLSTQFATNNVEEKKDKSGNQQTLLNSLGLEVEAVTDPKIIADLKKRMSDSSSKFFKAYKVVNSNTEERFKKRLASQKNKNTELYFHGSRNENWWSLMQKGLLIRPSNAVHTGSLLGDALYFAPKAQKSIGYTSLSGSYWTKGNAPKGYMAIFEVHTGKKLEMRSKAEAINNAQRELWSKGYDSVHAFAGASMGWGNLRNDEVTVYDAAQSTVRYLIELR